MALCLAGMDLYDAVVHSFATISTGGFSTRNASIAAFGSPAVTWIVAIFMFLSGINFSLIFISLRGHIRAALHSEELRLYTLLTLGAIGLIAASLMVQQSVPLGRALKDSVFNAVSTVTTTGFATADFAQWPVFGQMLLVILMFTGACAGSTSGGIKVSRILLLGSCCTGRSKDPAPQAYLRHHRGRTAGGGPGGLLGGGLHGGVYDPAAGWGHPSGLGQPGLYGVLHPPC